MPMLRRKKIERLYGFCRGAAISADADRDTDHPHPFGESILAEVPPHLPFWDVINDVRFAQEW